MNQDKLVRTVWICDYKTYFNSPSRKKRWKRFYTLLFVGFSGWTGWLWLEEPPTPQSVGWLLNSDSKQLLFDKLRICCGNYKGSTRPFNIEGV